jgi:hypothetical protein
VNARRTALLRQTLDQHFDFLAHRDHEVGEFVDDDHDLRQDLIIELLFLVDFLAGIRIEPDLDRRPSGLPLDAAARTFR